MSHGTRGLQFLLRITSPTMPLGGFSYSGGLESAIDKGLVSNENDAAQWIEHGLCHTLAACEGPLWLLAYASIQKNDADEAIRWNRWYWASRDSQELRQETQQMGWSLRQVAMSQSWGNPDQQALLDQLTPETYLAMHAYASVVHGVDPKDGLLAFFYAWADNQTLAAIKTLPLGQSAGQRILAKTSNWIDEAIQTALKAVREQPPAVQTSAIQLSILSSQHEHQYSRLFRS